MQSISDAEAKEPRKKRPGRSIALIAMRSPLIWLFLLSLATRAGLAVAQIAYGIQPNPFPTLTLWNDFYYYYVNQLSELAKGLLPYRDFAYSYTPLFLYGLYPFYLAGGQYAASIPIIVADSATALVIYLIVKEWAADDTAILAGIGYCILPLALIYEGYLWLSSQPMTLFMMLGAYLAAKDRQLSSAVSIGIAGLFKQEALFILPAYVLFQTRKIGTKLWKAVALLAGTLLLGSLPFLILAPQQYLSEVSFGLASFGAPYSPLNPAAVGSTVSLSGPPSTSTNFATITLTLIGTHVGCTYSYMTPPNLLLSFTMTFLDKLGQWVLLPLLLLVGVSLYANARRSSIIQETTSAYSIIAFLTLFSYIFAPAHRYYLVPVYALILASSRNKKSVIAGIALATISLLTPAGMFQLVLASLAILSVITIEDSRINEHTNP